MSLNKKDTVKKRKKKYTNCSWFWKQSKRTANKNLRTFWVFNKMKTINISKSWNMEGIDNFFALIPPYIISSFWPIFQQAVMVWVEKGVEGTAYLRHKAPRLWTLGLTLLKRWLFCQWTKHLVLKFRTLKEWISSFPGTTVLGLNLLNLYIKDKTVTSLISEYNVTSDVSLLFF